MNWNIFKTNKKKSYHEILIDHGWKQQTNYVSGQFKVEPFVYEKNNFELLISEDYERFNIQDVKSGARLCADLDGLEEAIKFVMKHN